MLTQVLLINPVKRLHPPFGLLYIAASLEKAGLGVKIFEVLPQEILSLGKSLEKLHIQVSHLKPLFVGITCMSSQAPIVKFLTKWLKEHFSDIRVVLGGVHPTFMPGRAMGWGADFVVLGEGEKTVVDLAAYIADNKADIDDIKGIYYRKGHDIVSTGWQDLIDNLDEIEDPAYHLIPRTRFTRRKGEIRGTWLRCAWLWTSRGCPSRCTFCAGHVFFGKKVRFRSLDSIFRELDFLVREFHIEAFYILDDTFTIRKDHVLDFCKKLKAEFPRLRWSCQARVNFFNEELARALKESGCIQVDFGVESGSQRILDLLKKGIRVEETERAFAACRKYDIRTLATVMIGNPTENMEDVDKTRKLLRKIEPDFVYVTFITPFPGTELYDLAKTKGLLSDEKVENKYTHELAEPLEWSSVDKSEWEKIYDEFSKWDIMRNYLLNPLFLLDMSRFSILHPRIAGKILYRFIKGDRKSAFKLLTEAYI